MRLVLSCIVVSTGKSHQSIKTRQLATNSERVRSRSATSQNGSLCVQRPPNRAWEESSRQLSAKSYSVASSRI